MIQEIFSTSRLQDPGIFIHVLDNSDNDPGFQAMITDASIGARGGVRGKVNFNDIYN